MKKKRPPKSGDEAPGTDALPAGTKWIPSAAATSDSTLRHLVYAPMSENPMTDSSGGPPPPSMNVEFDILQWNPLVDEGAGFKPVQAGGFVYIEVPSPSSEGLFSTTAKVRIRTVPTVPLDQSNALCAQWTAEIIQNIVHFGSRQSIYQHSKWITTLDEIPCLDHNLGNDESKDFTAANETVQVKVVDTPGFWTTGIICLDASTGMPVPNPLNFVEDDVKFITWLTVRNRTTGERRFLRWVSWRSRWKLTVSVPPNVHLPTPAPTAAWQGTPSFTIISGGVGQGSVPAVFNKRKMKENRVPPLP